MRAPFGSARAGPGAIALAVLVAIGLTLAAPAEAQRLGRLFFSPEEREALEEARREFELGGEVEPEPETPLPPVQDAPVVRKLKVDGMVRRSDGLDSIWVNRTVVSGGVTREGMRVEARGREVELRLPSGGELARLRPGQELDVESGAVTEGFEREPGEDPESTFGAAGEGGS